MLTKTCLAFSKCSLNKINKYISKQKNGYTLFYPDGPSVVEETPRDETQIFFQQTELNKEKTQSSSVWKLLQNSLK